MKLAPPSNRHGITPFGIEPRDAPQKLTFEQPDTTFPKNHGLFQWVQSFNYKFFISKVHGGACLSPHSKVINLS